MRVCLCLGSHHEVVRNVNVVVETGLAAVPGSMVVCGAAVVKGVGRSVSTSPTLIVECVDDVPMNSQVLRGTPHIVGLVPNARGHELTTGMIPVAADSFWVSAISRTGCMDMKCSVL